MPPSLAVSFGLRPSIGYGLERTVPLMYITQYLDSGWGCEDVRM